GDADERGVGEAHWYVGVLRHELADPGEVVTRQSDELDRSLLDLRDEFRLRLETQPAEQMHRLGERWPGCHQRRRKVLHRFDTDVVIGLVLVDQGHERPCVGKDHARLFLWRRRFPYGQSFPSALFL